MHECTSKCQPSDASDGAPYPNAPGGVLAWRIDHDDNGVALHMKIEAFALYCDTAQQF